MIDAMGAYLVDERYVFDFPGSAQPGQGIARITVTASSVPEPSTWAMMTLGFAGLGFFGYRKTKSSANRAVRRLISVAGRPRAATRRSKGEGDTPQRLSLDGQPEKTPRQRSQARGHLAHRDCWEGQDAWLLAS